MIASGRRLDVAWCRSEGMAGMLAVPRPATTPNLPPLALGESFGPFERPRDRPPAAAGWDGRTAGVNGDRGIHLPKSGWTSGRRAPPGMPAGRSCHPVSERTAGPWPGRPARQCGRRRPTRSVRSADRMSVTARGAAAAVRRSAGRRSGSPQGTVILRAARSGRPRGRGPCRRGHCEWRRRTCAGLTAAAGSRVSRGRPPMTGAIRCAGRGVQAGPAASKSSGRAWPDGRTVRPFRRVVTPTASCCSKPASRSPRS